MCINGIEALLQVDLITAMFKLKVYKESELGSTQALVESATEFCSKIENDWSLGKKFDGVQTYTKWINSDYWAARVSTHDTITFEELRSTILENHTENEVKYQDIVLKADKLDIPDSLPGWESASVLYTFPFPLKKRVMTIWLYATELPESAGGLPRFIVLTFPREAPNGACYVSFELVEQLPNGSVKWTMAQTSNAGGWIPQWLQRMKIEPSIAQDIPFFEKWLKEERNNN